jgi:hypothetical protein
MHIIVLNVHAPTEDKIEAMKDSFYEELERIIEISPKTYENFVGDFNAKVGLEDLFKPINANKSLHEISNDNGI